MGGGGSGGLPITLFVSLIIVLIGFLLIVRCEIMLSGQLATHLGSKWDKKEGRKEMFYLTTHSTHFIYGYMASDIW